MSINKQREMKIIKWLKLRIRTLFRRLVMGWFFLYPEDTKATELVCESLFSGLDGFIENTPFPGFITLVFNDNSVVRFGNGPKYYTWTILGEHGKGADNYKWSYKRLSVDLMWELKCEIKNLKEKNNGKNS
jgi:hypothetical protein